MSGPVVEILDVAPAPLAGVRRAIRRAELGQTIMSSLDTVYALLRGRGAAGLGHNVVVYRFSSGWGPDDRMEIEVGVQTPAPIEPAGEVLALATPGGRAARATHVGPYAGLGATDQAVRRHLRAQGLAGGVAWEVYGDWSDDPATLETDVFILVREAGA